MAGEQGLSVEQEAANMGWVPQEQFRGDPEKWVDAETFVERGHQIMPILRANNRDLQTKVTSLQGTIEKLQGDFSSAMEDMKSLQIKAVKEATERTKKEVLASLKEAKESGDVDAELVLTEQLGEVNQQLKELNKAPETPPATKAAPVEEKLDPVTEAWMGRNAWFNEDPALRGMALGLAQAIKADPATSKLTGEAFYSMLDERLAGYLPSRRNAPPKVEGSRGAGSGGEEGGGKSYNALPADAKAECERDAARFVGEGKAFKTIGDWRKHFANLYFGEE